ncbi:WD repeat-containing protein 7 [Mortierella polycephala]|uniref:WD repeat-containing protein 7 n=1 Tax=Mortierella polycephala TaxID=41804 RepID=A0A9P6U931_9FUNG|nr:WD repeat-containing protein 7 [Mortierella polycephala]
MGQQIQRGGLWPLLFKYQTGETDYGACCFERPWSGTEVACFNNHSRPVAHFLQVPENVNSRIRKSVISIAEDHSVAIISIEEMNCIYLFGGYEHALLSIQWRPPEDYVVLWHADETAFVWQIV